MVLSDRTIKEELAKQRIVIDPLDEENIQPASVDLRLDRQIVKFVRRQQYSLRDIHSDLTRDTTVEEIPDPQPYVLEPGQFILGSTLEYVELPDDVVARLEGKSSLGRLGLLIHSTAGYVDPGWKGQLTLEISNVADLEITLYYGMKISQISFLRLSTPADRPYGSSGLGSKYQGQVGPTPARSHLEFGEQARAPRNYASEPTALKKWLDGSQYEGSVARMAAVLEVERKTAEDWVYGRYEPSHLNRQKLFELTNLPIFSPQPQPKQATFLPEADDYPQAQNNLV